MLGRSFEGGTYLQTTAKEDLMQGLVMSKWSKIFDMELERTYDTDFEIFGEKAQNPSDCRSRFLSRYKKSIKWVN